MLPIPVRVYHPGIYPKPSVAYLIAKWRTALPLRETSHQRFIGPVKTDFVDCGFSLRLLCSGWFVGARVSCSATSRSQLGWKVKKTATAAHQTEAVQPSCRRSRIRQEGEAHQKSLRPKFLALFCVINNNNNKVIYTAQIRRDCKCTCL